MKKILLSLAFATLLLPANAASFMIDGKEYAYDLITSKSIGPGVVYNRIRIPDYPLNINYMMVDVSNPYNRIENQQANEQIGTTEKLEGAYERMQKAGKKPLGAQNANFWVVNGHGLPNNRYAMGTTFNANVKNGQIITETNNYSDQWVGGPTRSGVIGIDKNKNLRIEAMEYRGWLSSEKWGDWRAEIIQCNRFGRRNEMVMFNSYYPKNKPFPIIEWGNDINDYRLVEGENTEVYLDLEDGQKWAIGKDFTAVVKEIKTNTSGGVLGDYDLCLTANGDNYLPKVNQLAVGDKVTLNFGWRSFEKNDIPEFENVVGGNAIVLKNGELTDRNFGDDYNDKVYSRSSYGMSEDGKTLYMFVIDLSQDPVYGRSAGCTTSVMCQIMKQLGAYTVCNVDAGGSAQLMVQGKVVNRTTESTPRAVANGWMVYSIAPNDDKSNVISRIEFLDPEIKLPIYTTYKPTILGYNVYGELISENVEGFTMECDAAIGTANGDKVDVGGTEGSATITAKYGDITVTRPATVVNAEVALRSANILLDGRDYPVEVVASTGYNQYLCDPSRVEWTVSDETVATITNGVLKGHKNGTTEISGTIGGFSTQANVTIELPEGPTMPVYGNFPTDAEIKQVGGIGIVMTEYEKGFKLNYTGQTGRGQYIEIQKEYPIWSLPEKLKIRINPGETKITKITATAKNAQGVMETVWTATSTAVPNNEYSEYEFKLSDWCDPNDVANFPITLEKLRFTTSGSVAGKAYEIVVSNFEAVYTNAQGGIAENVCASSLKVYPNPVTDGIVNVVIPEGAVGVLSIYNMAGGKVLERVASEGTQTINVSNLQAGIYLVEVNTDNGKQVSRIIVK